MGRKDSTVLRDFPAFSNRMIIATLQIWKHWAREKYELNMGDSSWRSKGLNNLRKDGKILSGSAAPLLLYFSWSGFDKLGLLTLAKWFKKMFALVLMLVIMWPLSEMASFRELTSGVPFKPWMTFYMFVPSGLGYASSRKSFQLSALAAITVLVPLRPASIYSCWFW